MKKDEDRADGQRLDAFRVAVALEGDSPGKQFSLSLIDKKTQESVHTVSRTWPAIKHVVVFVRSVAPKLDVPPLPGDAHSGVSAAVLAEDKRKFVQTYVNTALQTPAVCGLREVQDLVGFADYLAHETTNTTGTDFRAKLRHVSNNQSNSSFSGNVKSSNNNNSIAQTTARVSEAQSSRTTADETVRRNIVNQPTSVAMEVPRNELESCFRLLDDGGAGYIVADEMTDFFNAIRRQTPNADRILAKVLKEPKAYNASDFCDLVQSLAVQLRAPVRNWVKEFQEKYFTSLYSAIGQWGEQGFPSEEYDAQEVRALMFVLWISGVRNISKNEIDQERDFSLPLSLPQFEGLMDRLCGMIALDELLRCVKAHSKEQQRVVHAVNRAASKVRKEDASAFQELILSLGGSTKRLGKCGNCELLEQRARSAKLQITDLEAEVAALRSRVGELEEQVQLSDARFMNEASQATAVAALEMELSNIRLSEATWETKAQQLEEQLLEAQVQSNSNESLKAANVYLLQPSHYSSHPASEHNALDLPGPIMMSLPPSYCPYELLIDLYLTEGKGCEYLALRDENGARSFCWSIEQEKLFLPWVPLDVTLSVRTWHRLQIRFDWNAKTIALRLDGSLLWSGIPLRDSDAVNVQVLDIYPRNEAIVSYANVRFVDV